MMNADRQRMIESSSRPDPKRHREDHVSHRREHKHKHHSSSNRHSHRSKKSKFPTLNITLPELSFPKFADYTIQESADFESSCEDEYEVKQTPYVGNTRLDRLRTSDGGIDLGLNLTDLGRIESESDHHNKSTRKMINYDTQPKNTTVNNLPSQPKGMEYKIPFQFGDSGSTWRMMKLSKLDEENGRRPSNEKILEQYSTIWDYDLACLERDEIKERKYKRKSEWHYEPTEPFMKRRKYHMLANKVAMKDLVRKEVPAEVVNDSNDDRIINMKKQGDVKMSKSKRLRNELKLAHLTSVDYNDPDEFTDTLSREKIESLTDF